jgi:hypothetical protein
LIDWRKKLPLARPIEEEFGRTISGTLEEALSSTGAWELLAIDPESPYLDERSLLVAGQAEVREYRARFWDRERAWRAALIDDKR